MANTVAIVQARMGSTRFPGKMVARLDGLPLLEWVLRRISRSTRLDCFVLATSTLTDDDVLVETARSCGAGVFRGDEADVLGRFAGAAAAFEATRIVRVCADNPFVDPAEIDRLINAFDERPCDYACNHRDLLSSGYADGFGAEILQRSILDQIDVSSTVPRHREHVTAHIWDHADRFTIHAVAAPVQLAYPALRFDVDTPSDLERLRDLVRQGVNIQSSAAEIIEYARASPSSDRTTL